MSKYIDIYVAAEKPLEEFVQEVEHLLKLPAQRLQDGYVVRYELLEEQTVFIINEPFMNNYDNFNLEDYRFCISVLDFIQDAETGLLWQRKRAEDIYQLLKATEKYRLLMLYDDEHKLDEFIPMAQQQPLSDYALKAHSLPQDMMIFIGTGWSLDAVAEEVERLIKIAAQIVRDNEKVQYVFQTSQTRYRLLEHGREQLTKPYEKYAYILHIEGRVCRLGERRYWQYESGRELFEQLKQTGRYSLALVGDSGDWFVKDHEYVIEEFVPGKNDV